MILYNQAEGSATTGVAPTVFFLALALTGCHRIEKSAPATKVSASPELTAVAHPPINGVYLISTAVRRLGEGGPLATALTSPLVDGVYLSLNWDTIEPERDRFDWTEMDKEVATAVAAHKKFSFAVVPGQYTPQWVYDAGAKHFDTVVEPSLAGDFCAPIRLPIPWDTTYLDAWTKLVRAFGARYAKNPALSLVKITGVSYRTDETSLPFGTYASLPPDRVKVSPKTGKSCVIPDDLREWREDGYTWSKTDAAFKRIAEVYKASFPGLPMGIMTTDHSFPPLSSDGRTSDNAGYALSTTDFFSIGRNLFGTGFVGQCNCLKSDFVNDGILAFSATNPTGYQTGMPTHDEPLCVMNEMHAPCDEMKVFQATMDKALGARAHFLEVFYNDVNYAPFEPILKKARQELLAAK